MQGNLQLWCTAYKSKKGKRGKRKKSKKRKKRRRRRRPAKVVRSTCVPPQGEAPATLEIVWEGGEADWSFPALAGP